MDRIEFAELNEHRIAKLLQGAGYRALIDDSSLDLPIVNSASSGQAFMIVVGRQSTDEFAHAYVFLCCVPDHSWTLKKINEWNAGPSFTTAYIDENDCAVLKMRIMAKDTTTEKFLFHFALWNSDLAEFIQKYR
jgi:Putative bacterial sensory transduction regulator